MHIKQGNISLSADTMLCSKSGLFVYHHLSVHTLDQRPAPFVITSRLLNICAGKYLKQSLPCKMSMKRRPKFIYMKIISLQNAVLDTFSAQSQTKICTRTGTSLEMVSIFASVYKYTRLS